MEQVGTLIGAIIAAATAVWAGWRKISPVLDRLAAFLGEWAGDSEGVRSIPDRIEAVEQAIKGLAEQIHHYHNGGGLDDPKPTPAPAYRDMTED